ncbi:hypothetical protein BDY19DRAFT_904463 [Irpex rosettiformis]|uniref:Uncharacterized protein n=1 Tax=Irpex rosettiformis TaxID=378272 RepID=A0ACB8U9J9_9APHY|nr:hypothetical protein BDY19DRAFT_904463 [Irpex rosettiformis]
MECEKKVGDGSQIQEEIQVCNAIDEELIDDEDPTGHIIEEVDVGDDPDVEPESAAVDLPAYCRKNESTDGNVRVAPKRYFYVPAGIFKKTLDVGDFYISEDTLARHLLLRTNVEGLSTKKVRINAVATYTSAKAVEKWNLQLSEKYWDNFKFEGFRPDGASFDITTLTEEMVLTKKSEVEKLRTWTKFVAIIRQKSTAKNQLRTVVTDAYAELKNDVFDPAVITAANPESVPKLYMIGHNLFGLFDTYMTLEDYQDMA